MCQTATMPSGVFTNSVLTRMLRHLTHVIAISECTKRDIQQFIGIPEERITVIHHAADTRTFYPRDKQASFNALSRLWHSQAVHRLHLSHRASLQEPRSA